MSYPYVICDSSQVIVSDIWDQDSIKVQIDVLLPTGYYLNLNINRETTLQEIKEVVWELSQSRPLFSLLRDPDSYVFQCINLCTALRDELVDEERTIGDVRPFQGVLRLIEKKGDETEKRINARLSNVIGKDIREFEEQVDPEVREFRKTMKLYCHSMCQVLMSPNTWENRILRQYPVTIESTPEIPAYLQGKLHDGNLMLSISIGHQTTSKIPVPPRIHPKELFCMVLQKRGHTLGLKNNHFQNHIFKLCGLEEFFIGPYPLSQYRYIRDCLSSDKIPELVLIPVEEIQMESEAEDAISEDKPKDRSHNCDSIKRKKPASISSWTLSEPLTVSIHSVHKLNCDSKTKIAVQCGLYHADENLCKGKLYYTSEALLEEGRCTWEENIQLDLELFNLPRMATLCICVFEISPTPRTSRFRKCQDKYACPIAWVNVTVFDYKGALRSALLTLSMWSYSQEGDEYSSVMVKPLGCPTTNPSLEQAGAVSITFRKYHATRQIVYPSVDEILEYANDETTTNRNGSFSNCGMPQASKSHLQQLQQICEKDTLYQLHEQEKELMWFLRQYCCEQLPNSLPKLLRCLKWNDRTEIAQMTKLLQSWPVMPPYRTLELLDYAYPDPMVRSFAVKCLRMIGNEELSLFFLQLVQALKHEAYLQNSLVKFLLERSLENRHNGHKLFWLLRSEIHFPEVSVRFGLILEAYCRSMPIHLEALEKQVEALEKLKKANNHIQKKVNIRKEGREKIKSLIQEFLGKNLGDTLFRGLQNPLDPRFKFGKIRVEKCKCLDSKMKPLWLAFENTDTYGKDVFLIFKNGDDLRQDMLTLQMIRIMDRLWKEESLDLRMIPYQCMATGHKEGLIEVVSDSDTIANIQKEKGFTATSAFKKGSILSWLKDHNSDESSLNRAAEEFTLSCAGYCVATYVLGVADRHSDNIMVKTNGQLFHVDFGHILGKFKEKFGFKRERVPFVLTHDFVYIITKGQTQRSQEFSRFQKCCERAFMILRRKGPLVISLFAMMLSTGIPELSSEKDLDYLRETLVLDMSEQEALKHFQNKFDEALKNSWKTSINWAAHNMAKDNKMAD